MESRATGGAVAPSSVLMQDHKDIFSVGKNASSVHQVVVTTLQNHGLAGGSNQGTIANRQSLSKDGIIFQSNATIQNYND